MAEITRLVPAEGRSKEELVSDLHRALTDLEASGERGDVRIDVWWDEDDPEIWMRTTTGPRVRWTIRIVEDGIEILVRGPFGIRVRLPRVARWLVDRLEVFC